MGRWIVARVDGLAEVWSAMQMDGPVVGCPMETGGPGSSMGRWTVSNGDGWASGWLYNADGWAEAW